MANNVFLKKSSVASKVPLVTDLDYGELAINYTDGKLYFKNSSNVIKNFITMDEVNAADYVTRTTDQTITGNKTFSNLIIGSVNGNAATATTLQTTRTINGVSFNGSANILIPSVYDSNYRRISQPGGGEYVTVTPTVTGAIAIQLPTAGYTNSPMISFEVCVYEYTSNKSFTIFVHGFQWSVGNWVNTSAYSVSDGVTDRRFNVRFSKDTTAGRYIVYIGELASTWSYPQVFVKNVTVGYAPSVNFVSGWGITFESTAFATVASTIYTRSNYSSSSNVVDSLVLRDASGNFSAGTITATLGGDARSLYLNFTTDLDGVTNSGVYRQESASSGFNYTTTLNLNSSDGRQQLTIDRGAVGGMKFRGNTTGSGTSGWSAWKTVVDSSNFNTLIPATTGKLNTVNSYNVATGALVSIYVDSSTGINLTDGHSYRFQLVTVGTGAATGASYIVYQISAGGWTSKLVSRTSSASNSPSLSILGTQVVISHNHASTYEIRVLMERYSTGNTTIVGKTFFGIDGTLTYDGDVDIMSSSSTLSAPSFIGTLYGASSGAADKMIWAPSLQYPTWGLNYNEGAPDKIEFLAGGVAKAWVALDDGSASFSGNVTLPGVFYGTTAVSAALTGTTTTATTQISLASWGTNGFSALEILLVAIQGTIRHTTKLLVTHDGTTAIATEYATLKTSTSLFNADVDISGGNVRLLITPTSATSTTFRASYNYVV